MREQQRLDRNKANVMSFYDLMFNQSRPAEAIEQYGVEPWDVLQIIPAESKNDNGMF